jgi:predicted small lipoprotein YifL
MIRSRVAIMAVLALAVTLTSCGRGDGPVLYPVQGKVMYKGQPAVGATVMFQREDGPTTNAPPLVPIGLVDEEGNFSLETEELGYGAPAGKYKVLIQWRTKGEESTKPQASLKKGGRFKIVADKPDGVPDRLQGRYMKAENALIKVEVKPEQNTLQPFDISS